MRKTVMMNGSHLTIEAGMTAPDATTIVERKGLGHPDTLADHLAERLSRAYSRYTVRHFGAVLHHNFDKLALLGGASEVRYAGGAMTAPVRVLVNGRAAPMCGGERIPVTEVVEAEIRAFFAERLPEISDHLDIVFNITSNSSPGAVLTDDGVSDRTRWFNPRSIDDLRERRIRLSNDTSLVTGWAPENRFESFVRELVDHFSGDSDFTRAHSWCGSDVKLMGCEVPTFVVTLMAPRDQPRLQLTAVICS
ncbi:methionine adenosyltransferase [Streptomyces smyrnaeus]|uniref:methionine adenosyltransferase n=1 Tax=Streptomyces smyrnaeus TaxID=1387713 RepID=UPI0036B900ED